MAAGLVLAACASPPAVLRDLEPEARTVARVLRTTDRAAFDALIARMAAGDVSDPTQQAIRFHAYLRTGVVPTYVPLASDEAIRAYVRVTMTEIRELRDASYARCFAFLFGSRTDEAELIRLEATLSPATRTAAFRAIANLMTSAEPVPVSVDEEAVWHVLDNRIVPALPAWLGERTMVLRDARARDLDGRAACDVTAAVYAAVVDLPGPDGAAVMRYLLARQMMAGL